MALRQTLYNMAVASIRTRRIQEIRLARGLIVSVHVKPLKTQVQLWRSGATRPSIAEWRTVISNWPYPARCDEPAEIDEHGLHGLSGSWPTPTQSTQSSFPDTEVPH